MVTVDKNVKQVMMMRLKAAAAALEKNNMSAFVCETKEDALKQVEALLHDGATVGCGGSVSLEECGVMSLLKSGRYRFIDRTVGNVMDRYREMYGAEYFLCSSNAVTESGELYNVDGNSNRISMIAFGPDKVIMVVGCNKVVRSLREAELRVKQTAAPANCVRLSCKTYCAEKGRCLRCGDDMFTGCDGETICCNYLVSRRQRQKGRITVVLVAQELGY